MLSIVMPLAELAEMKNGLQFYSGNFNEKKNKNTKVPSIHQDFQMFCKKNKHKKNL